MSRTGSVLGVVAVAVLAGCGSGDREGRPLGVATRVGTGPGDAEACSTAPSDEPLPSFYPPGLELPTGAVVTGSTERESLATVSGFVPGELEAVHGEFGERLRQAGLPIQTEDYEGFEAEYFFGTTALQGVIRVVEQPCLPGRTSFALSLRSRQ